MLTGVVRDEHAILLSVSTGGDDAVMALPVDIAVEDADCSPEEYAMLVAAMKASERDADFGGGTSSVHTSPENPAITALDATLKAISIGSPALGSASAGHAQTPEGLRLLQGTLWSAEVSEHGEEEVVNPNVVHVATPSMPTSVIGGTVSESSGPAAAVKVSESS